MCFGFLQAFGGNLVQQNQAVSRSASPKAIAEAKSQCTEVFVSKRASTEPEFWSRFSGFRAIFGFLDF